MAFTRLRTTKRAGAVALALAAGSAGIVATAGSASATNWDAVAQCESGGNWSTNTGNGFGGGLQFTDSTWQAYGGSGSPESASKSEQIAVAERVAAGQGMGAWPVCGANGGSSSSYSSSSSSSSDDSTSTYSRSSRSSKRTAVAPKSYSSSSKSSSTSSSSSATTTTRSVSSGVVLSKKLIHQHRADVVREQKNLNRYGAHLDVDGHFGPLTEAATKAFQVKHGLSPDGQIGPNTKAALHR
jgi:hypothetical protein